jgi:hypothetical protein
MATTSGFSWNTFGCGKLKCAPIEMYIRTSKNPRETKNLLKSNGLSVSLSISTFWEAFLELGVLMVAPYPALFTAEIISLSFATPSTIIEFVKRLTEQESTPSSLETAFSTRDEQAAQLIPLISNFFKKAPPYLIL